jgi:hypothetical protein
VLWFAYPKGRGGFNRDAGWEVLEALGWRGVRMVAIDNVRSAKRVWPALW